MWIAIDRHRPVWWWWWFVDIGLCLFWTCFFVAGNALIKRRSRHEA